MNYRKIIESCMLSCKHVWVLSITRPSDYVCNKSYRMLDHIITYNEVIRTLAHEFNCDIIDVFSGTENDVSLLANDGYHLSELGHKFIFEEFERTFIETS
jgi:lysophospholipase L1-like esterase